MSTITVVLCLPEMPLKQVRVNRDAKISVLNKSLGKTNKFTFIYSGAILSLSQTFAFYNIENEAFIVALAASSNQGEMISEIKWIHITKDPSFVENMQSSMHPEIALEATRLRDLRFLRVEQNRTKYYQLTKLILKESEKIHIGDSVIPAAAPEPSCEALPCFWIPDNSCC